MLLALLVQTLVTGTVTEDSARPVTGAIVEIKAINRSVTTNARGLYSLTVDRPGTYLLEVRALGLSSASRALRVASGDTLRVDFALGPVAQELAPVVVTEAEPQPTGIMRGFEERRRAGFGRFITRDMLAEREHDTVAGILRGIAGMRMVRRPSDCGGGFSAATGRGIAAVELSPSTGTLVTCGGKPMAAACYMSVYIDGVRLWAAGSRDPPDFDQLRSFQYEGIEIYRGPSELPIQYQGTGAACGAILLWSRISP
jgi:hypothetical protein